MPGVFTIVTVALVGGLLVEPSVAQQDSQTPAQTFEQCACRDVMSPTQVANAFWEELRTNPDFNNQVPIVTKYLQLVTLDSEHMPDNRLDRLALGEAAFLTFQVQPAYDYFATLLEGDDLVTRHAWLRMMQIRFRALDEFDETRDMLDGFYEKFPPSETDKFGRRQQIINFSNKFIRDNKPEDAIALIVDELRSLPHNAPYSSYSLLRRYSDAIGSSPREKEIRDLVAAKLPELKKLSRRWAREKMPASEDPVVRGIMPTWYWRQQEIQPGESLRAARQRELETLIINVKNWLEGPAGAHISEK